MLGLSHASLWVGKFPGKRPPLRSGAHLGSLLGTELLELAKKQRDSLGCTCPYRLSDRVKCSRNHAHSDRLWTLSIGPSGSSFSLELLQSIGQ
jgi:hypothetical protein